MLARLVSIPAILVGGGLLYVGYLEIMDVYILSYIFLGSTALLLGVLLLLGFGSPPAKAKRREPLVMGGEEKEEKVETKNPDYCPNCGTPLVSAGKFCGTCGKSL